MVILLTAAGELVGLAVADGATEALTLGLGVGDFAGSGALVLPLASRTTMITMTMMATTAPMTFFMRRLPFK
jgi:hypothetical protein